MREPATATFPAAPPLVSLSDHDYRGLLEAITHINAAADLDILAQTLVTTIGTLIPNTHIALNEVNVPRNRMTALMFPDPDAVARLANAWTRYSHEHPTFQHFVTTNDPVPRTISEFLTLPQFHNTGLYNHLYRELNASYQISVTLPSHPGFIVAIAINRDTSDFTPRDRTVLSLLQPHMSVAYNNAAIRSDLARLNSRYNRTLQTLDEGIACLASPSRLAWYTPLAGNLLSRYFPKPRGTDSLPDALVDWLTPTFAARRKKLPPLCPIPFLADTVEGRLAVRFLPSESPTGRPLLLLSETPRILSSAPLLALGLTPREADILLAITTGKTNPQIAVALHAKPRTIQKHVENILRKLNVSTRTAASALALQHLRTR